MLGVGVTVGVAVGVYVGGGDVAVALLSASSSRWASRSRLRLGGRGALVIQAPDERGGLPGRDGGVGRIQQRDDRATAEDNEVRLDQPAFVFPLVLRTNFPCDQAEAGQW